MWNKNTFLHGVLTPRQAFLPTKQAQLTSYALWPLLFYETVADSLNTSELREEQKQEWYKWGIVGEETGESRDVDMQPDAKSLGIRVRVVFIFINLI